MKKIDWQRYNGAFGMLLGAAVVMAVLATLIMVPSSPMSVADQPQLLFSVAFPADLELIELGEVFPSEGTLVGLSATYYSAFLAVGTMLALLVTAVMSKLRGGSVNKGLWLALCCGVCALICSRLLFACTNWDKITNEMLKDEFIDETTGLDVLLPAWLQFVVQPWRGGYTMYGAIFGVFLGSLICALCNRDSFEETLVNIVPAVLLMIVLGRAAEQYTSQGRAMERVMEAMPGMPFHVFAETEWGIEFHYMLVYPYEVLAALVSLIAVVICLVLKAPAGRVAEMGLGMVSVLQIMLDSWRNDDLVAFGFVRLNMILAAVVVVFILVTRIIRCVRSKGWGVWTIARIPLFLLSVAVVIILEFGLDGKLGITASNTTLYIIQAVSILVMGVSVLVQDGRSAQKKLAA